MLPFAVTFRDGNEAGAKEYPCHALDLEKPRGKRRNERGFFGVSEVARAVLKDGPARKKLQSRRVRRCFGLNEHNAPLALADGIPKLIMRFLAAVSRETRLLRSS